MNDPNAIIGVVIPIIMPTLYTAVGRVEVAGFWDQLTPQATVWRAQKAPAPVEWKPWKLPPDAGRL